MVLHKDSLIVHGGDKNVALLQRLDFFILLRKRKLFVISHVFPVNFLKKIQVALVVFGLEYDGVALIIQKLRTYFLSQFLYLRKVF